MGALNPEKLIVSTSVRTQGIKLGSSGGSWLYGERAKGPNYKAPRYPRHLIPQKGDCVTKCFLAMEVVNNDRITCLDKVTGFDLWHVNDLSFVAQPVYWYGKLAKVVIVGVRLKDFPLLGAQRQKIYTPTIIEESYQAI